jgi:hypothetical protein
MFCPVRPAETFKRKEAWGKKAMHLSKGERFTLPKSCGPDKMYDWNKNDTATLIADSAFRMSFSDQCRSLLLRCYHAAALPIRYFLIRHHVTSQAKALSGLRHRGL